MARFIALYLPQYHPIPENDEWWGKGFTEWTNVAMAKPLFPGHKQPHIPADLGFYDLRLPIIREQQAELARQAGIEGFCYYHYWFGNGKQLLERPFNEVLKSGKPDFPFCLAWANHSWRKKTWQNNKGKDKILIEQTYPGVEDYENHFYSLLSAFKDKRYIRINDKLFFIIYNVPNFKDVTTFVDTWRKLAKENGLNDFYFVGTDADSRKKEFILGKGLDAIYNVDIYNIHHHYNLFHKVVLMIGRKYLGLPTVINYKDAMKDMINEDCVNREVIPVIAPNWDHSPRSGRNGILLRGENPKYFQQIAEKAIDTVKNKPKEEQIIIIKSWNEWGEGNYMEPDLEFGHGYIDALRQAIENKKEK